MRRKAVGAWSALYLASAVAGLLWTSGAAFAAEPLSDAALTQVRGSAACYNKHCRGAHDCTDAIQCNGVGNGECFEIEPNVHQVCQDEGSGMNCNPEKYGPFSSYTALGGTPLLGYCYDHLYMDRCTIFLYVGPDECWDCGFE